MHARHLDGRGIPSAVARHRRRRRGPRRRLPAGPSAVGGHRSPAAAVLHDHRVQRPVRTAVGGDPEVGGFGLGGIIDLARLISLGLTLVAYAALLAWTTTPAGVGLGIGRLLRPLGRLGLPADELATVVALTVRALPLIRDELMIAYDARRTRPEPHGGQRPLRDLVDMGAVVVVGAHRRAGELSQALVARGSVSAPADDPLPLGVRDGVALGLVAVLTVTVFVVW